MVKRILAVTACALSVMMLFAGCGKKYVCDRCDEVTSKAYYDVNITENSVLCEDCAREYWMPLDYNAYRVK